MEASTMRRGTRAVVLGASMGGLLAARALNEHFEQVVVLERDELPDGPAARKGTPQAIHPHGLLARGRAELEALFPGFTQALMARGAVLGDIQHDAQFMADGQPLADGQAGAQALCASRLAIEHELRCRVQALPGVQIRGGVNVVAPQHDAARGLVTGVRWRPQDMNDDEGAAEQLLEAQLVVDCTGRGSRSPAWLASWGYAAPLQEDVAIGICYTSAYFRRSDEMAWGAGVERAVVIGAATHDLPRPGVLIAQEPDSSGTPRWVVGVGGYQGDHVEPNLRAMRERSLQLGSADLIRLLHEGEMLGEPIRYKIPSSQRRRYERLSHFPKGFLVMADAITSFNPIYGQGMTVAACQAQVLRAELRQGLDGLHRRFFRAAAKVIDVPWQLAVGSDLDLDCVEGPRPFPVRMVNRYIARLRRVAVQDTVVAQAFLRVVHMLDLPPALFAPRILWRVWRGLAPPATPVAGPTLKAT